METKDLILLMLIPIILVSIVIYTDKSPAIIGAVTSQPTQQEESNIIGTYSIMPSFKAKTTIDYNLEEEYQNIDKELNKVIDSCKNSQDIEQCFKDKAKDLNWNCEEPKEEAVEILHDFVNKVNECIALEEDGVVCRFSLEEREISKLIGKFFILLTNENQRVRVDLTHGKTLTDYLNLEKLVYTDYDNRDTISKSLNSVRISIEYMDKKPVIEYIIGVDDNSATVPLSKTLLLYKKDKTVKFVEHTGSSFEAIDPFQKIGLPKIINLPITKGFKFCAKTGKQIYAYDKTDDTVKLRDIVYKFAVTFPNPPTPPAVQFLKAEDKQKAENSIILRWNKVKLEDGSDFPDFSHYNIYCSKNTLEDKSTKEIKIGQLKPTMAVKSDKNYDEWVVEINKCGNEDIQDNIDYYFAVTTVSKPGKESKSIRQATTKSVDDLSPGIISKIILLDSEGSKLILENLPTACMELPKTASGIIGNIRVGFFPPEKNEDEITNLHENEQLTYLLHYAKQLPVLTNLDICERRKCVPLDFAPKDDFSSAAPQSRDRTFDKNKEINQQNEFFVERQTYCFTIVARDNNKNVISTLSTPYSFSNPPQWINLEKGIQPIQPPISQYTKEDLMGRGRISSLLPEVQQAFNSMKDVAQKEDITLNIVSGYRSFERQKTIWNTKYLNLQGSDEERISKIVEYSAVPGLSRHHLGTDLDINSVNPADFAKGGKYYKHYQWMLENAEKFGFCQAYNTDRLVKTEPWHWSYKPISKQLTVQHISIITSGDLKGLGILGESAIISNFDIYHKGFISDINGECVSSDTSIT